MPGADELICASKISKDGVYLCCCPSLQPSRRCTPLYTSNHCMGTITEILQAASLFSTLLVSPPSTPTQKHHIHCAAVSLIQSRLQRTAPGPWAAGSFSQAHSHQRRSIHLLLPQLTTDPSLHTAAYDPEMRRKPKVANWRLFDTTVETLQAASFASTMLVSPPSAPPQASILGSLPVKVKYAACSIHATTANPSTLTCATSLMHTAIKDGAHVCCCPSLQLSHRCTLLYMNAH